MNNVETVKQMYADFGNGNIPGILNVLAEDISWNDAGYPDLPFGSINRKKKEVPEFFKTLSESVNYTKFEPREFVAEGNNVIAIGYHEGTTKPANTKFGHDWVMVWKFDNSGMVKYVKTFVDTNEIAKGFRN